MPHRLKIEVGDWADYDMIGGLKQKRTVLAIDDKNVHILVETRTDENILRTAVEKKSRDSFLLAPSSQNASSSLKSGEEDVIINNRPFRCSVFESKQGDLLIRSWISSDAPLDGLVQMARGDEVILRLRSFGKAKK